MSMFDVARFLSYSRSVDLSPETDRYFNLSMVDKGHLFSCLHGDSRHWSFGRQEKETTEKYQQKGKRR